MSKYFQATADYGIEATQEMDPAHPGGSGLKSGIMTACVHVYEPSDECQPHPSLPTLREFLAKNVDPASGILTFSMGQQKLSMDPAPLRDLPSEYLNYRVSPGCIFVTHESLAFAKGRQQVPLTCAHGRRAT